MAKEEIQDTSDYKLGKDGRKVRAHKIVFNKGEEDGTKIREQQELGEKTLSDTELNKREDIVKGMKKNYKDFTAKYGDKAKSVMYATATKLAKEETEQIDELSKTTLGSYYNAAKQDNRDYADSRRSGDKDEAKWAKDRMVKRSTGMGAAKNRLNKEETKMNKTHPFDIPKSSGMATSTRTKHDVKKTSTGTVYTKQRDADGMAKEFKRDLDQAKRGRGRPKKNSFAEAAEFLMSLDEELFDSLMEDGFDAFVEHYEQLDELSKSTLSSYVKKAADDRADTGYHSGYWDRAHGGSKPEYKTQAEKEDGQEKRKAGIHKALHRLTK